jgi:hypothetical protein
VAEGSVERRRLGFEKGLKQEAEGSEERRHEETTDDTQAYMMPLTSRKRKKKKRRQTETIQLHLSQILQSGFCDFHFTPHINKKFLLRQSKNFDISLFCLNFYFNY